MKKTVLVLLICLALAVSSVWAQGATRLPRGWYRVIAPVGPSAVDVWLPSGYVVTVVPDKVVHAPFLWLYSSGAYYVLYDGLSPTWW